MHDKLKVFLCLTVMLAALLAACPCASADVKKNLRKSANSMPGEYGSVIMGTVKSRDLIDQPILVIANPLENHPKRTGVPVGYMILDRVGEFMLYLPPGKYQVFTVVDFNEDDYFDESEASGSFEQGSVIHLGLGEVISGIEIISASAAGEAEAYPGLLGVRYDYDSVEYSRENGQIVKIYDVIFSAENAKAGLWSPERFFRAFGANIFFVEPYDPKKIPILFVHGVSGSPQNWIPFLIRMDRKRYQPWFFYYPSGIRLKLIARLLHKKLSELHRRHGFEGLCLTAHSMGGFVTRTLLTDSESRDVQAYLKLYITLATPWAGFKSADTALVTSPVVLPNWIDVASRSIFIKKLLKRPLPASIPFYLFYGKNDKISAGRALDERAFAGAAERLGFNVTHEGILSDKKVFQAYSRILNSRFRKDQ